jgi:drug/metabolite transporter (DMT)-like permease
MQLGILYALIATIGFGLTNALSKIPAKKIGSIKSTFYRNVILTIILIIVFLFFIKETNFSPLYILIAFGISLIGYLPLITLFKALKRADISVVSPIAQSSVIFTVIFSFIFFRETLTSMQLLAGLTILAGVIILTTNFKNLKNSSFLKFSSGIPYALITCFTWGIFHSLLKVPISVIGPILTALIIESGLMIYSGIHLSIKKDFKIPKSILPTMFLVSATAAIGTIFFNLGIQASSVSLVAIISTSIPVVATIFGVLYFKEKLSIKKILAILIILAGIAIISL